MMRCISTAAAILFMLCAAAPAQWQAPNHALRIGTGWNSAAPRTSAQPTTGRGPSPEQASRPRPQSGNGASSALPPGMRLAAAAAGGPRNKRVNSNFFYVAAAASGFIDVTDPAYGATCDGSADDTAAIQNAMNAAGYDSASSSIVRKPVLIPGKCVVTSAITIHNAANNTSHDYIFCAPGGGLLWGGAADGGDVLRVGDFTGLTLETAFHIDNCLFSYTSNKPTNMIHAHNVQNIRITNSNFYQAVNASIFLDTQCLLCTIEGNVFYACTGNCIWLTGPSGGTAIKENHFLAYTNWAIRSNRGGDVLLFHNYFEGHVNGTLGSIYLPVAHGDKIMANAFEDGGSGGGPGFRSLRIDQGSAQITDNYWLGGTPPDYWVQLGTGVPSGVAATFVNNQPAQGRSGYFIYVNSPRSTMLWIGGLTSCNAASIWGGPTAAEALLIAPCGIPIYSGRGANSGLAPSGYSVNQYGTVAGNGYVDDSQSYATLGGTCSYATRIGNTAGRITTGGNSCSGGTLIITFSRATAAYGWACRMNDLTAPANAMHQTATTTTSVTFTGTYGSAETLNWICMGY